MDEPALRRAEELGPYEAGRQALEAVVGAAGRLCVESWADHGPWLLDVLLAAAIEVSSRISVSQNDAYHGAGLLFSETPSDADVATMEAFEYWRSRWAGYNDDDCSPSTDAQSWLAERAVSPASHIPRPYTASFDRPKGCWFRPELRLYFRQLLALRGVEPALPALRYPAPVGPGVAAVVCAHRVALAERGTCASERLERFLERACAGAAEMASRDWAAAEGAALLDVLLLAAADAIALAGTDIEEHRRVAQAVLAYPPRGSGGTAVDAFGYWAAKVESWSFEPPGWPYLEMGPWMSADVVWDAATHRVRDAVAVPERDEFAPLNYQRALWSAVWDQGEEPGTGF